VYVERLEKRGDRSTGTPPRPVDAERAHLPQTLAVAAADGRWVKNVLIRPGSYEVRAESAGQQKTWTADTDRCGDALFGLTLTPEKMVREMVPCY